MGIKINLAKSAGFCFGVKRAIDIAYQTKKKHSRVYILGDLVHNEEVMRQISKAGIKKINRLSTGSNSVLLARAHGTSRKIIDKAISLGYTIVDATCPMVKEIHKITKEMERRNYKIIIIGDKKHDEVQSIIGQLKNKPIVIDGIKHIPFKKIKNIKKACAVVQSTQNLEKTIRLITLLQGYIENLKFFNTICRPTRIKQEEIKNLPLKNDLVIIIGSKSSANTKRLYEISKTLNKRSFWVNSKKEIKSEWFNNASNVGITAGASTPAIATKQIIKHIKKITRQA